MARRGALSASVVAIEALRLHAVPRPPSIEVDAPPGVR
jgi:hypothetical protein